MDRTDPKNPPRREFLIRCAKAGLLVSAAAGVSGWLYQSDPPELQGGVQDEVRYPDFSIRSGEKVIAIAREAERRKGVQKAVAALGGIEKFVETNDRVLLKVNAAFASPPSLGATTHPDLVEEVVRMCLNAGAKRVVVTDNPINDPTACFSLTGIGDAAVRAGADVTLPMSDRFRPTTVEKGTLIRHWPVLFRPFEGIDKVINMAPLKDHHRSGASMTLKNWYGLLGGRRNIFHQDIHRIIMELGMMIRPTFVILDGTFIMVRNGPTGGSLSDLLQTGTIIAGTDAVAVDSFGATLLNKTPEDLPFLKMAQNAGVGTTDYESLDPVFI